MKNRYLFEEVKEAVTFEEMRAEMARLRFFDPLIRQVMDRADYEGLSAEDRYTLLSYCAIKEKCTAQSVLHEYILMTPSPTVVLSREYELPNIDRSASLGSSAYKRNMDLRTDIARKARRESVTF